MIIIPLDDLVHSDQQEETHSGGRGHRVGGNPEPLDLLLGRLSVGSDLQEILDLKVTDDGDGGGDEDHDVDEDFDSFFVAIVFT